MQHGRGAIPHATAESRSQQLPHAREGSQGGACLALDLVGELPEAGVLRRLPPRALDRRVERLLRGLRLAPQRAHLHTRALPSQLPLPSLRQALAAAWHQDAPCAHVRLRTQVAMPVFHVVFLLTLAECNTIAGCAQPTGRNRGSRRAQNIPGDGQRGVSSWRRPAETGAQRRCRRPSAAAPAAAGRRRPAHIPDLLSTLVRPCCLLPPPTNVQCTSARCR